MATRLSWCGEVAPERDGLDGPASGGAEVRTEVLVELWCAAVAEGLVERDRAAHQVDRVEGEHGCAVLVGEVLRGLQQGLRDAVSPGCRVHGKSTPARPSDRPAKTLGCGIGVEGAGSSHGAVHLGDDQ